MQWNISVTTWDKDGGRDVICVVAAPTSIQAVLGALATLALEPDETLYSIQVGRNPYHSGAQD